MIQNLYKFVSTAKNEFFKIQILLKGFTVYINVSMGYQIVPKIKIQVGSENYSTTFLTINMGFRILFA